MDEMNENFDVSMYENVNRAMTSNENLEDNLRPCWTMNQSFVIFHVYFYSCLNDKKR